MELKTGSTLQGGKYKIEKVLGKGGFGITYLAYQQGLNRYVAVKEFFMSEYCNREESTCAVSIPSVGSREMVEKYRSKFVKEAQTIAELDNPHIVPIHDVFEENGTAYYVMKYIGGGSLSSLVRKGEALPVAVALKYVRQVAEALAYCHERNIAHLDVKPGNILIQDGVAVLIDFGISKHYNDGGEQTSSTPVGISKGYAPLEQYKRGGVTTFSPVTDIYSLGAVLFRLVTGQIPPDADEVNEEGLPEFPSHVSQYIQEAITAAMQPKKKDRPQSIDDFLALLVEPVVEDDETEPELEEDDEETPLGQPEVNEQKTKNAQVVKSKSKILTAIFRMLLIALAILLPCILGMRSLNNSIAKDDAAEYMELLAQMDSLVKGDDILNAQEVCDEAVKMEEHYADTRHTQLFNCNAKERLSILLTERKLMEDLEKERLEKEQERQEREQAEKERLERERKEREEAERKRRETGYSNGILKVNGIEYPMIYVSGGSFMMGYDVEKPVHRVTLSSYHIGKYEVTQDLWEAVMGTNPSRYKGTRRPVERVSYRNCLDFIGKLNELTGQNFRLPTEAEWEFAARGGNSSRGYKYSGSDDLDAVAWYADNSGSSHHNVGTKSPNELGIYDMSGNVWEWCRDWYASYGSSSQTNPKGPSSGSTRVNRGGSWDWIAISSHVSFRYHYSPDLRFYDLGLRLCL